MRIHLNLGFIRFETNTTKHQIIFSLIAFVGAMQLYAWGNGIDGQVFALTTNVITGVLTYAITSEKRRNG